MDFSLNEIGYEIQGKMKGVDDKQRITGVSTDTRTIALGDIFVAIVGENFNGHDYAQQAVDKGAVAVVVENANGLPLEKVILVKDTKKALVKMAGLWRRKCRAKVVGITGSVGKTTTKELTARVLETAGKTLKTQGNLNNEVGLSQMLLQLDDSYDFAVFELGVDGPGQMQEMAKAVAPDVAIITNIGLSHIEAFKLKRRILKEKLNISAGLKPMGTLLLNGDDPLLIGTGGANSMYFAIDALSAEIQGRNISIGTDSTQFTLFFKNEQFLVHLPVAGVHNVSNALAALGAGLVLGVGGEDAVRGIESYQPEGMRQRTVQKNGFTVIEDCYNAAPQSMVAALETFHQMEVPGRKLLLLGDMLELGHREKRAHIEIGVLAASLDFHALFATGPRSQNMAKAAKDAGMKNVYYFEDPIQTGEKIKEYILPEDTLWAKASRGMQLENVLEILYQEG